MYFAPNLAFAEQSPRYVTGSHLIHTFEFEATAREFCGDNYLDYSESFPGGQLGEFCQLNLYMFEGDLQIVKETKDLVDQMPNLKEVELHSNAKLDIDYISKNVFPGKTLSYSKDTE